MQKAEKKKMNLHCLLWSSQIAQIADEKREMNSRSLEAQFLDETNSLRAIMERWKLVCCVARSQHYLIIDFIIAATTWTINSAVIRICMSDKCSACSDWIDGLADYEPKTTCNEISIVFWDSFSGAQKPLRKPYIMSCRSYWKWIVFACVRCQVHKRDDDHQMVDTGDRAFEN